MPKVTKQSKVRQTRMDFFLPSSPSKKKTQSSGASSSNGLRQATIQSLSRVVSVDHIIRCKNMLKDPKTEKVVVISTLQELSEKIPSREVLQNTKIGHVIRKLAKSEDADVAKHANVIYDKWKTFFVEQSMKSLIDVKCSSSTENCRRGARQHLAKSLEVEPNHDRVIQFEREAFHLCKTMTLLQYKRIMRAIILKTRSDHSLVDDILQKRKKTSEIVNVFK